MDKDEQPITGATIKIKDSTTGALTDIEGFYKLELEEENPVLIVSFMGYITQEVKVGKKSILNIQLEEDTKALDEVVVTAFGIGQKKESLVGAIQQIRPEQLRVPSSRLSSSLRDVYQELSPYNEVANREQTAPVSGFVVLLHSVAQLILSSSWTVWKLTQPN